MNNFQLYLCYLSGYYKMTLHSRSWKNPFKNTKKTLFACALMLIASNSFSQVSVGFGLRSHFGGMQAFKDVKGFYNDNRPWLDKEFSTGGLMNGIEFGLNFNNEDIGMSLINFYYVGSKTTAKGTSNGVEYKRVLKARMWGMETFDFRWTPIHLGQANIGFGVMPLGLSIFRAKTQLNDEEVYKPPYSYLEFTTSKNLGQAMHIFAQVHADISIVDLENIAALNFQFFYTFGPKQEYSLHYLNKEMNPTTYPNLYERTYLKINNFGMKLMVTIY